MDRYKLSVGDILKVTQPCGDVHYEKVIQTQNEILTEDMPEGEWDDISKQGLCDNWDYEIVPAFKISQALAYKPKI